MKAQQAPSPAQSRRLRPFRVASVTAQRKSGGRTRPMAAATATVSRAFQGELNRFCLAHRVERRTPSALHDGDTAIVPIHERGGDEVIARKTPITSTMDSIARPDWLSTVPAKICTSSG